MQINPPGEAPNPTTPAMPEPPVNPSPIIVDEPPMPVRG
jgi:hypothetical protein